ncbi:hypothetical protein NF867_16950 [Solitalea sp. MAHUQ-68]|uniref:Formyl transferase N-terminal domain-containing protein n=1 Tax=Solitalea agri TaxID=2953739 RepID=A0A9X2FCX4_9SPHI|nr:formyltransferase family protein [Solitalea agri]MCO4294553.1 hypothetical protein [Solitalea agri]
MKVIYIGTRNSIILESLITSGHQVIGIVESRSNNPTQLRSILCVIYDNFQRLNHKKVTQLPSVAKMYKIPLFVAFKNKQDQLKKWVSSLNPEIILIHGMTELLKKEIFNIPKYGAINLHQSLLPNYRGPNPDFWVYYYMDLNPGVTVHKIDSGEDSGDILLQESFPLKLGTSLKEYRQKYLEIGSKLMLQVLTALENNRPINPHKQSTEKLVRARRINPIEYHIIIDWQNWPIERIFHFLRGTMTHINTIHLPQFNSHKWDVVSFKKEITEKPYGSIIYDNNKIYLVCKDGLIELKRNFSLIKLIKSLV